MRKLVKGFVLGSALAFVTASPVMAQEKGKVGMTFGFPASVGILWHATEKVAVRPEIGFSWNTSESGLFESDSTTLITGISALFYVAKWDDLSAYVSPRYTYNRASSESAIATTLPVIDPNQERVIGSHLFSGSFGAQYWFGSRFSAFGEFGLAYGWSKSEIDSFLATDLESRSLGTRTAAGFVFYF